MQKKALITGATGLLGSWLTCELLKKNSYDKVFLLIRSRKDIPAKDRLKHILKIIPHNLTSKDSRRIEVIDGDVTKEYLGIGRDKCLMLMSDLTDIYHSAALAEFGLNLKRIRPSNVQATKNLLRYASSVRKETPINFHHISTVAVAGSSAGYFGEGDYDKGQGFNNSYERTKFEAESEVLKYQGKNLNVRIYRPAIITGDSEHGITTNFKMIYQPLHFMAHKLFDELPADGSSRHSLVSVDKVAQAISILSDINGSKPRVFQIVNPSEMRLDFFVDTASKYFNFKKPKLTPLAKFPKKSISAAQWKLIDPFVPYLNYKLRFKATQSNKILSAHGFKWPKIDQKFLNTLYQYCEKTKFKPAVI